MDILVSIFVFVIGTCIGSFLNVVIYRLPNNMNICYPSSHCTTCDYVLKWYDNIPIFSYLFLGGKCRKCKQRISPRYMIVELLTGLIYLGSFLYYHISSEFFLNTLFVTVLIPIIFIDYEHKIIPDSLWIILFILGIISIFFQTNGVVWYERLIGAFGAGGFLWLLGWLGSKLLKKESMGFGDVKLMFAGGMFLGYKNILLAMFMGCVLLLMIELPVRKIRKTQDKEIPFGPYLSYGMVLALLFGTSILSWYFGWFM